MSYIIELVGSEENQTGGQVYVGGFSNTTADPVRTTRKGAMRFTPLRDAEIWAGQYLTGRRYRIVPTVENQVDYSRFTDRARKVMQLANQEAQRFNHECIGTEHILLGLVKEGTGVAANVLKNLDIDPRKIRLEVEKLVQVGPDMVTMGRLPHTPNAKRALEYAVEEAHALNHSYVGSEHILLGLMRKKKKTVSRATS